MHIKRIAAVTVRNMRSLYRLITAWSLPSSALTTSTSATLRHLRNRLSLHLNTHMLHSPHMPSLRPLTGDREQACSNTDDMSLFIKNRNQPTGHVALAVGVG